MPCGATPSLQKPALNWKSRILEREKRHHAAHGGNIKQFSVHATHAHADRAFDPQSVSVAANLGLMQPTLLEGANIEVDVRYRWLVVGFYGTVIALIAVFQGLNAIYYFTRRKHVESYVRETPAWVLEIERLTLAA